MERQNILFRNKKWSIRMFYFLDLIMSDALLLYKRMHGEIHKADKMLNSNFLCEFSEVPRTGKKTEM